MFSALPLLRYLRGHTIFDYELWYATGTRVLAGDEIFFFRAAKYEFMYPPPCALFLAGASLLGQGGLILLFVMINSAALVLQRETERQSCYRQNANNNKVVAISRSKCAGARLRLGPAITSASPTLFCSR